MTGQENQPQDTVHIDVARTLFEMTEELKSRRLEIDSLQQQLEAAQADNETLRGLSVSLLDQINQHREAAESRLAATERNYDLAMQAKDALLSEAASQLQATEQERDDLRKIVEAVRLPDDHPLAKLLTERMGEGHVTTPEQRQSQAKSLRELQDKYFADKPLLERLAAAERERDAALVARNILKDKAEGTERKLAEAVEVIEFFRAGEYGNPSHHLVEAWVKAGAFLKDAPTTASATTSRTQQDDSGDK